MNKFTVFGNPIQHSLSPQIHNIFAKQAGIDINYTKTLVEPIDKFVESVKAFQKNGGIGANVTVPFKINAYQYADRLTDMAILSKAVNTLSFSKDGILGDNTDGKGLIYDLTNNYQVNLDNQSILIIGAGGATMGIIPGLLAHKSTITLANRTFSKAQQISDNFQDTATISPCGLDDIQDDFDIIINATTVSLSKESLYLNPKIIKPKKTICYDLMYAKNPSLFMQWGLQNQAKQSYDGFGMLVAQAAFSFYSWHKFMPEIKSVLEQLR